MKKILVPCDFSPCSSEALKFAIGLRDRMNASIHVIHISYIPSIFISNFTEGVPMGYYEAYCKSLEDEATRRYEEMLTALGIEEKPSFEVIYSEVASGIIDVAHCTKTDFIVMGSAGESGKLSRFFGTTTQKVVQHAEVPVFVIHKYMEPGLIHDILLPSQLTLDQGEFISRVKAIQELFNARLHLLLVNTPFNFHTTPAARQLFTEFIHHYQLENCEEHFYSHETEEAGIADFAQGEGTDLIMMGTHARKGLAHLLAGSITDEVLMRIESPIVTYHLKKSEQELYHNKHNFEEIEA